jgi:cobalamin biosynthesis protein CbiG
MSGVKSEVHDDGGAAAVCEIVAGIAALRGHQGLDELAVDLAGALADVIERIATAEGLAVEDVANALFFRRRLDSLYRAGIAAIRLRA